MVISWWCDFMGRRHPRAQVTILQSFVAISIVVADMFLVCHMFSKDYTIIWSCDFVGRSCLRYVTILLSFVAKGGDMMVLICHMILWDHVINGSSSCISGTPSWLSQTHAKFGGHRHHGSGDIIVLIYHVILQDHMIKGFCDFMGSTSSR